MNIKYYFELDRDGNPLEGSNIKTARPPMSTFKRWKEIIPLAIKCCDPETDLEQSEGRAVRYWVKLDMNNLPISGSLMKHKIKPSQWAWQEVIGAYCCGTIYNPTIDDMNLTTSASPYILDLLDTGNAADLQGGTVTFYGISVGDEIDSEEGNMTLTIDSLTGNISISQVDDGTDNTDTFTLTITDGRGHHTTFTFTVAYTAP